jgi:hypothetical protein
VQARALLPVLAVLGLLAGCNGEEEASDEPVPAADQGARGAEVDGRAGDAPGAPDRGEPAYAGLGSWWVELDADDRVSSAAEFVEANPDECTAVAAEELERQTRIAFGLDFPLNTTVSEVMLETCALIRDGG